VKKRREVKNIMSEKKSITPAPKSAKFNNDLFFEFAKTKVVDEEGKVISCDLALRNKLVLLNKGLVNFVIDKYYRKLKRLTEELRNEMIQEGTIGLIEAVQRFDPSLGFRFATYATYWIYQSISLLLQGTRSVVKVPSNVRVACTKTIKLIGEKGLTVMDVLYEDGEEHEKMMKELNLNEKELENLRFFVSAIKMSVPLGKTRDSKDDNQQMSGNEDDFIYNLTGSSFSGDMDEERSMLGGKGDYAKITTIVKKVFDTLPEREKQVLMLRYENQEMMENQHNE